MICVDNYLEFHKNFLRFSSARIGYTKPSTPSCFTDFQDVANIKDYQVPFGTPCYGEDECEGEEN